MINKFQNIILFSILSIMLCTAVYGENLYTIKRNSNKIKLVFNENWCFSEIKIPVYSPDFWGDKLSHNIALLEIGSEKHILSQKENSDFLDFSELNIDTDSIQITSINTTTATFSRQLPYFKAIQSHTKYIEDNLLLIIKEENNSIIKNNCFSCHTLIPAAITIKTAQAKGFNIDKSLIDNLFIEVTKLQNKDGSFFFENQPCYGKNSTTLAAGYLLALLSDNMPDAFIKTGEKINEFLKTLNFDNNLPIKADFIFEPFFNSETTTLLHETIFQKSMYLKANNQNKYCNERANVLLKQTSKHKNDTFVKKMLLLTGIPYSYQLPPEERASIIEEIKNIPHFNKNKTTEILKLLSVYVYKKIAPYQELPFPFYNSVNEKNNVKNIWKCFEKILYNNPKYLNGNYDESKN